MKKYFNITLVLLILAINTVGAQETEQEIQFKSKDDLKITGDLYLTSSKQAPFIILFHQAGYSRGEYIETAIKFNQLGFNCLAIDQRSGKEVNNIINQTHLEAKEKGLETQYVDAMPDLESAIDFVIENYKPKKLIILGSSYSATLSIVLAAKYPEKIDAALAFSPGEYFLYENKKIQDFASKIKIPVFITSAKKEVSYWEPIYNQIAEKYRNRFIPEVDGIHGSRALWKAQEGNETYWAAVKDFLNNL